MSGSWAAGWATDDLVTTAEFIKGVGSVYDITLGTVATTIDITSIPQGYAHLLIEAYLRTDRAAVNDGVICKINNDAATLCRTTRVYTDGATVTGDTSDLTTGWNLGIIPAASAGSNRFGVVRFSVPHYAGATNHKTFEGTFAFAESGNRYTGTIGGAYEAITAITRLTLRPSVGTNFAVGSRLTCYAMGA